jgi:hypothetical protein
MDTLTKECYITGYETTRSTPSIRATKTFGDSIARIRRQLSFCSRSNTFIPKFRRPMASIVSERGKEGLTFNTQHGTTAIVVRKAKGEIATDFDLGTIGCWLPNRSVDTPTYRQSDRERILDTVFTCQLLETDDRFGLELSKTRKACQRKGRGSHRSLEAMGVAPYKKTLKFTMLIWSFWTKADFSWYLLLCEPGQRREKLPSSVWRVRGTRYQPFPLSVFPQNKNACLCISNSMPTKIYGLNRWWGFFVICCGTYTERYSCSGIEAALTRRVWLSNFWESTLASIVTSFQRMPQNSIPMNWYGRNSNGHWVTASPRIPHISGRLLRNKNGVCNDLRHGCGLVSMLLIYPDINSVSIN